MFSLFDPLSGSNILCHIIDLLWNQDCKKEGGGSPSFAVSSLNQVQPWSVRSFEEVCVLPLGAVLLTFGVVLRGTTRLSRVLCIGWLRRTMTTVFLALWPLGANYLVHWVTPIICLAVTDRRV